MVRPLREDRDSVADKTLTIRLTAAERAALDELVRRRRDQLAAYGVVDVSAASVVRTLIQQATTAEGLLPARAGGSVPSKLAVALPPVPAARSKPAARRRRKAPAE